MNNEYKNVLNELRNIKSLVKGLKKDIEAKDKKIDELLELLITNKIIESKDEIIEIDMTDPKACYKYAYEHISEDNKKYEQVVLNSKDLELNYLYMKNIMGNDFKSHLKVILDSKNPEYNYYVAINFDLDLDTIAAIRKIIVDSKNLEYNYNFASDIEHIYPKENINYDVSDLQQVILDSNNLDYYYLFAKHVKGADISLIEKYYLNNINSQNIGKLFEFAVDIQGADFTTCREKIVELYNAADNLDKAKIADEIDTYEKKKVKCVFRSTFADKVDIK